MKVYLFHSDWCEGGYTDPRVEVYSTYELALERLNNMWNTFMKDNRNWNIEVNDKDCKRWQDNEYVYDVYIEEKEILNKVSDNF